MSSAVATSASSAEAEDTATIATTEGTTSPAVATGLTNVSDIAATIVDSVVAVEVTGRFRGAEQVISSGSGVILDTAGNIITNAHVVAAGTGIIVVLADGTEHPATVVAIDTGEDLALIRIDAQDLNPVVLGSTQDLRVGDPVIAVGNPLGLVGGPSVSTGIVSALDRSLEDASVRLTGIIQTDAAITVGSSGGALLDSQGRLIGITTAVGVSSVGVEGIGFAIPVEAIVEVTAQLLAA